MEKFDYKYSISVCTPTYNRASTLNRVFESLKIQTFTNFEWIIVDDGSNDNTNDIVLEFQAESVFPIKYFYQKNKGKHNAVNKAVSNSEGKFIIIADSDDAFISTSFEVLIDAWSNIPEGLRDDFKGVSCRCVDEKGQLIGAEEKDSYFDSNELEVKYIKKRNYELWGMIRTDIMKQYPFPNICGLRFYPEIVIWDNMALRYKTRYINTGLRIYYKDQEDATTFSKKNTRYRENYYLWLHYLNDIWNYHKYDRKQFLKALIGIMRDGLLSNRKIKQIIRDINSIKLKVVVILLIPISYIFVIKDKKTKES